MVQLQETLEDFTAGRFANGEAHALLGFVEAMAKIEQAAASMGMSVEEYNLGMRARIRLTEELDSARISSGDERVSVTRDGNNPPKFLEIEITDAGKAADCGR